MRAHALDFNAKFVARGHDRPFGHAEVAGRHAGPVVNPKNSIDGKLLEQAVLDHGLSACAAFFGGLEDKNNRAVELPMPREILGRAKQHRGVAIVATCVHLAVVVRAMIEGIELLDRQRVHIGAQTDHALAAAALEHTDNAGLAHAAVHFDAPFGQLRGDQVGSMGFFIAQFGMRMDRSSKALNFALGGLDFRDQFHG